MCLPEDRGPRYYLPAGSCQSGQFEVEVTPAVAGWTHASLRVLSLAPGDTVSSETGPAEMLVLPLAGACEVSAGSQDIALEGRRSVFSRVTDFAYVPRDATLTIASESGGRFALPAAAASRRLPVRDGRPPMSPSSCAGQGRRAAPVRGGSGARHVLPECPGRTSRAPDDGVLRRSGACLDPRYLALAGRRSAATPHHRARSGGVWLTAATGPLRGLAHCNALLGLRG